MTVLSGTALVAALRQYFSQVPDVRLAYLFGSQARGTIGQTSDVDIALLLDGPAEGNPLRRDEICSELMALLHRNDIDVVLADRAPALLRHRIARDGLVLAARGAHTVTRFITEALRDYVDTAPLRKEIERTLRRSLENGTFGKPAVYQRMTGNA